MSLENAILEHAQAVNNLASALSLLASSGAVSIGGAARQLEKAVSTASPAREAINEALAAAKASIKNKSADDVTQVLDRQELEQAVSKVEADAKKNAGAADTATSTAGSTAGSAKEQGGTDQAEPLSYEKDVKPLLVEYARVTDKDTMTKYVRSFGVQKATELPADKFAEIIAGAKKLIAEAAKAA